MWPSPIPLTNSSPERGLDQVRCQLSCLSAQLKRKRQQAQSQIGLTIPTPHFHYLIQSNFFADFILSITCYKSVLMLEYLTVAVTPGLIILHKVMFVTHVENNCLKWIVLSFVCSGILSRILNCIVQYIMWLDFV